MFRFTDLYLKAGYYARELVKRQMALNTWFYFGGGMEKEKMKDEATYEGAKEMFLSAKNNEKLVKMTLADTMINLTKVRDHVRLPIEVRVYHAIKTGRKHSNADIGPDNFCWDSIDELIEEKGLRDLSKDDLHYELAGVMAETNIEGALSKCQRN